jgi:hypothetical protein
MAGVGLITSVLAPAVVLLTADAALWRRVTLPAAVTLGGFVVLHAAITIAMTLRPPMLVMALAKPVLLAGAVLFWLPMLGPGHRRLSGPGRSLYLFLAPPSLDLAAVYVVGSGDPRGGLAMIVAMLPIGVTAIVVTWQWIAGEERDALASEAAPAAHAARAAWPIPTIAHAAPTAPLMPAIPPMPASRAEPSAGHRAASPHPVRHRGVGRDGLRICLAVLWLSAAALQAHPFMFTAGFAHQVLLPVTVGQPRLIAAAGRMAAGSSPATRR